MKIISEKNEKQSINKKKEFIPIMINRILAICKNDPHFQLNEKIEDIDIQIDKITKKIYKQKQLVIQSQGIKSEIKTKLDYLDSENTRLRSQLLESLGSDL